MYSRIEDNNKKMIFAIAGVMLGIALIGGAILVVMQNQVKWPPDDIYVYRSNGYMAYAAEEEDISIEILLCSLHHDGKNPVTKYENIYFETDTGLRYEGILDEEEKKSLFNQKEILTESVVSFELKGDFIPGNRMNFTGMILQKKDGTEVRQDFGMIVIEVLDSVETMDKIEVNSTAVISKSLKNFDCEVKNRLDDNVTVQEIYLGDDIEYDWSPVVISAGESREFQLKLSGHDDFTETPNYYIIKPRITVTDDTGHEYICAASESAVYAGYYSTDTIREYIEMRGDK